LHRSFCDFPADVRAAFDRVKTTVAYRKGETIFHESDRCQSVFAICEGSVKLITTSNEGRILLLRFARPGEMLGLADVLEPTPYDCSAIAAENSSIAVIARETFLRFVGSYPQACLGLTIALSEQYKFAQREARFLGFGETSDVRLAQLLLEWSAEHGVAGPDGMLIPDVTHGDLAQAIAATRETVTRLLGRFSRAGIIERQANAIVVLRPAELAVIGSSHVTTDRDGDASGDEEAVGAG
jgi:CRP/FNR family transcriptional regulator